MKTLVPLLLISIPCIVGTYRAGSSMTKLKSLDGFAVFGDPIVNSGRFYDRTCEGAIARVHKHRFLIRRAVSRRLRRFRGPWTASRIRAFLGKPVNTRTNVPTLCSQVAQKIYAFHYLQRSRGFRAVGLRPGFEERYQRLIHRIPSKVLRAIALTTNCRVVLKPRRCTLMDRRFRSADGRCNNLRRPLWGASHTMLKRFKRSSRARFERRCPGQRAKCRACRRKLPRRVPVREHPYSTYKNGLNEPRLGMRSPPALSPRFISRFLVNGMEAEDTEVTDIVKSFGQFIDHDLGLTPHVLANQCHGCGSYGPCFPIPVPRNDNRIKKAKCLHFGRSFPACGTGNSSIFLRGKIVTQREQVNEITHFLDSSNVYGSTEKLLGILTDREQPHRLAVFRDAQQVEYLPFADIFPDTCNRSRHACLPDFLAGDERVTENLQLATMHTLWNRFHNRIADQLKRLNRHWSSKRVFQESRRVVNGVFQKIVYEDYLKIVMGNRRPYLPRYRRYNPRVDPSILQAFTTSSFRLGHTQIKTEIARLNRRFKPIAIGNIAMHLQFFRPEELFKAGGLRPYIRGLLIAGKKVEPNNRVITPEVRERLFELTENPAADLLALNIQRGRDHGIPTYNQLRQFCGMKRVRCIGCIREMSRTARMRLKKAYNCNPHNIDPFVGGVMENKFNGGQVGKLVHCILRHQFRRLRDGDRFFYLKYFRGKQLAEIRRATLATVFCTAEPKIRAMPVNPFRLQNPRNFLRCNKIPHIRLSRAWRERRGDVPFPANGPATW